MKLKKYGVTLTRLTEKDIELVRKWRNSKQINQYMEYREYITPEMQKKWFKSIDNYENFYYIIEYKNKKLGLINNKNSVWKAGTSESGLFIWDEETKNSIVPVLASLCLIEFGFYIVNGKKNYIKILKNNKKAIDFSKNLGYVLCEAQENIENQMYVLDKKTFEKKGKKLQKLALKLSGNDTTTYLFLEKIDYESGLAQKIENLITTLTPNIKEKKIEQGKMFYL